MSILALPPSSVRTGTVYRALISKKAPAAPKSAVRKKWATYFRSTQAQGDCLYLCMIGHLQAEDPLARLEHLAMFKRHCIEKDFKVSEAELDAMFESWGSVNVKKPGSNVPVPEVTALRNLVSQFFKHHFEFYFPEDLENVNDDLQTDPPAWMSNQQNLQVMPEDFVVEIRDGLELVNKHYQEWRGGVPIELKPATRKPEEIKEAFANKIVRRYPNGDPFGDNTFNAQQAARQGINLSPGTNFDMVDISQINERSMNFAGNLEIHIMANMFGVNVNVFSSESNALDSNVEDCKMTIGVVAKEKAAAAPNKQTPWALIARNATHFDFLETTKFNTRDNKRRGYGGSHGEDDPEGTGDGGGGGLAGWGNNITDASKQAVRAATAASQIASYARVVKDAAERSLEARDMFGDFENTVDQVEMLYDSVVKSAKASLRAQPDSEAARSAIRDAESAANKIVAMIETAREVSGVAAEMDDGLRSASAPSSSSAGASSSSAGASSSSAGPSSSSWAGAFSESAGAKRARPAEEDEAYQAVIAAAAMFQLTQALQEIVTQTFAQRARLARMPFDALANANAIAATVLDYTTNPKTAEDPIAHARLRLVAMQATDILINFETVKDLDDYIGLVVDDALQKNRNDPVAAGNALQAKLPQA